MAIIGWTDDVTRHYVRIRAELERAGTPIGNMDVLIASPHLCQGMILVTNNLKHSSNVHRLKFQWA